MKKFKKALLLTLSLVLMLSFSLSAYAEATPRWNYMMSMSGDLDINNLGVATAHVSCFANASTIDEMRVTCVLQKLDGSWKNQKTWTVSDTSASILFSKQTAVYKNYSYRIKVTAKAYANGSLKETVTQYYDYGYYN